MLSNRLYIPIIVELSCRYSGQPAKDSFRTHFLNINSLELLQKLNYPFNNLIPLVSLNDGI